MILTYNLSAQLKKNIHDFEILRGDIALCPLSPIEEIRLRWNTTVDRIYYWLHLADITITRKEISSALSGAQKPTMTKTVQQMVNYRSALNHIYFNWLGNPDPLTIRNIQQVADHINYAIPKTVDLSHTLEYLQASTTIHPLIQAAIIHLQFASSPIAHLAPLIVLYKYGYDLRGMLCPESLLSDEKEQYFKTLQQIAQTSTITLWLEFYTGTMVRNAHHIKRLAQEVKKGTALSHVRNFNLTQRQKNILARFDEPEVTLTNKNIQQLFTVSQITASRDLSQLAALGLLVSRGKGRSTYYTRA